MMLHGPLAHCGYDWWWHSFTAQDEETGEDKAFFIEYFLCNPALSEEEPVLGQLLENHRSGKKPSYLMIKAGCWGEDHAQLHRFFSWKDIVVHPGVPYMIAAPDCLASETHLQGKVTVTKEQAEAHPEWMSDAGSMSWDLTVDKQIAFNVGYGADKAMREAEAFSMYWHAEGMKSAFEGEVVWNGRRYRVSRENSSGYADKNWGRDFTSPWVWLSSNRLRSRKTGEWLQNSVFDIGGGRPEIYFVPLDRRLLGALYYEGKEFDFNFSHFWLNVQTEFSFSEDKEQAHWKVRQENHDAVMETEIHCLKKDMLLIRYEAPDGSMRHNRLWNGGTGEGLVRIYEKQDGELRLLDEMDVYRAGCEYGEFFPAT